MSMSESMSEMKAEQEEADRVRRLKKQMKKMDKMGEAAAGAGIVSGRVLAARRELWSPGAAEGASFGTWA